MRNIKNMDFAQYLALYNAVFDATYENDTFEHSRIYKANEFTYMLHCMNNKELKDVFDLIKNPESTYMSTSAPDYYFFDKGILYGLSKDLMKEYLFYPEKRRDEHSTLFTPDDVEAVIQRTTLYDMPFPKYVELYNRVASKRGDVAMIYTEKFPIPTKIAELLDCGQIYYAPGYFYYIAENGCIIPNTYETMDAMLRSDYDNPAFDYFLSMAEVAKGMHDKKGDERVKIKERGFGGVEH